eukprot:TRINITY_DN4353_c0_g1_i6.p1 TRINITY_DN4353_c0_g1~~TRINITY_DN4353_c0_g1_i6.p1  ORF type:complete len:592 (+),score=105.09 TRINITY_DN4353_c0_g1_i6:43-1776(+)
MAAKRYFLLQAALLLVGLFSFLALRIPELHSHRWEWQIAIRPFHRGRHAVSQGSEPTRTLVLYAYYEREAAYTDTFNYFVRHAITPDDDTVHYVLIINGRHNIKLPNFRNVIIFKRKNECYDMGSYGIVMKKIGWSFAINTYSYFIFLNPSIRGPFMPAYVPPHLHWTDLFTKQISSDVKLVGMSINCPAGPATLDGRFGPAITHIMSMVFATDRVGLHVLRTAGVLKCSPTLTVALKAEADLSLFMLLSGFNIGAMELKFQRWDWRAKMAQEDPCKGIPENVFYNLKKYDGVSMSPFETIFFKANYHKQDYLLESLTNHSSYLGTTRNRRRWLLLSENHHICLKDVPCKADVLRSLIRPDKRAVPLPRFSEDGWRSMQGSWDKVEPLQILIIYTDSSPFWQHLANDVSSRLQLKGHLVQVISGRNESMKARVGRLLEVERKINHVALIFLSHSTSSWLQLFKTCHSCNIIVAVEGGMEELVRERNLPLLHGIEQFVFFSHNSLTQVNRKDVAAAAMVVPMAAPRSSWGQWLPPAFPHRERDDADAAYSYSQVIELFFQTLHLSSRYRLQKKTDPLH